MHTLNHIYRTIWSEALGAWIAVSEITKAKGKRSGSSLLRILRIGGVETETDDIHRHRIKPLVFALACCFALNVQANPLGGDVVNGSATFNNSGNTLTVTNTPGTIINWQSFSIGASETTRFVQQSAASAVLNRVVTNNPSAILGTLSSNGQVYLVNANGIMFGAGATVDVAGLVASTLDISNADFLAGRHNFNGGAGTQNLSNAASLNAYEGGQIWLIAPNVENSGIITAPGGEVLLAAGHSVEIVNSNDPALRVQITAPAGDATNLGELVVQSGSLGLFGAVVKNSGTASADSAVMEGGRIVFRSSQRTEITGTASATGMGGGEIKVLSDMQAGTVSVSGTLDASAPQQGDGGFIDTSAAHLDIASSASINASAANGISGEWLIDPLDVTIGVSPGDTGGVFSGGVWTPTATGSFITTGTIQGALNAGTNVTITTVNGSNFEAGDINVNWSITKTAGAAATLTLNAENNINFAATYGISSTTGALNVVLRSDADANGTGTVSFAGSNTLNALAGGRVDLFYNPTSYATPTTFTGITWGATAHTEWMLVNDVNQLQLMNTNLAGNYALGTSFSAAATATWNFNGTTYDGFAPVGDIATPFTGQFNGNAYTIDSLYINRPAVGYVGLFGFTNASTIKDVSLTNVNITGGGYVGSLAGWHQGSLANNSNASGSVTSVGMTGTAAGGLVGMLYNLSTMDNCSAGSTVNGINYVGGLVGVAQQSSLSNVSATGNVTGTNMNIGGLAGSMEGDGANGSSLLNATASGNVIGLSNVGGLVGWSGYRSTINTGIASGNVSGDTNIGGLVGMNAFNIVNSHATGGVLGVTRVGGLVGYNNWDGDTLFNFSYGTISSSYAMTGAVSGTTDVGGLVGNSSSSAANAIDTNYATGNVSGTSNVGGLVGYFTGNTTVLNSYASGNVTGSGVSNGNLGGLVGQMNGGTVNSSYSTATSVAGGGTSSSNVGGLVGWNRGTILNSYATVTSVSGGNMVGGLVGNTEWEINGSYVSTGSVTGTSNYGGLVGGFSLNGFLTNSHYNINGVTINGANIVTAGGLYNDNTANFNMVGQYTDWLVNGNRSLSIANYTSPYGSFGFGGTNIYTISNAQGLKDMLGFADNSTYTFVLTTGVDLTGNTNFYIPILASDFDGAGFTISNLNLAQDNSNLGMFGQVTSLGSVSNLVVQNATVNSAAGDQVGGLAGVNLGTITNSSVSTGVAGTVSVAGGMRVGGLVGRNDGAISNSFVSGVGGTLTVVGTNNVGGLAGEMNTPGSITAGYVSNANVSGSNTVGGLVGLSNYNASSSIINSYVVSSTITASVAYIGGLVGQEWGTHTNSYFNIDTVTTNGGNNVTASGLYATQYNAWFNGGALTPLSIANYSTTLVLQGDGSYGIGTQQGLKDMLGFADNPAYNFSLTGSINLTGMSGFYVPVLAGDFNGNGFTLSNLNLTLPNDDMGLFGSISTGSLVVSNPNLVSNLNLVNVSVSGLNNVGAVAGLNYGNIDTVTVSGTPFAVSGTSNVGGMVGSNLSSGTTTGAGALTGGNISNSSVNGGTVSAVTGGTRVGGLAGNNTGNISNSHVVGTAVSGPNNVGGLVGNNMGALSSGAFISGIISGSTVTNGSVTATGGLSSGIGGLAGDNLHGVIINSHVINPNIVGGSASMVGGLVGNNSAGPMFSWPALQYSISNSYVSGGRVASTGTSVGGLVGNNFSSPINASYVDAGTVNGGIAVGGLVGHDGGEGYGQGLGLISNSFVSNTQVTGTSRVGGLVGEIRVPTAGFGNLVAIQNSYVSGGSVSGTTDVGGLAGFNDGQISMAYTASGPVSGTTRVGGLVGNNAVSAVVSNSFWDINTTGQGLGAGFGQDLGYLNTTGVAGLTTAERMTMSSFTGWSIANTGGAGMTWRIYEGQTGPLLTNFLRPLNVNVAGSRVYDGTTVVSGLVTYSNGQGPLVPDATLLGTVVANTASPNVGTYTVAPSGLYSSQLGYDVNNVGGSVDITPASLTVTANNISKYEGMADPALTYSVGGVQAGDSVASLFTGALVRDPGESVGAYAINQGSLTLGSSNYILASFVPGVFSIVEEPLITPPILSELVLTIQGDGEGEEEDKKGEEEITLLDRAVLGKGGKGGNLPVCK